MPYPLFRELDRAGATLWSLPPAKLAAIIRREAARLDRDFLAQRAADARGERRSDFDPQPDFTADLHLHTSAEHAAAAYRNVDDAARAARRGGDPRTLDQLRADIAVGWLTEGAYGTYVVRPGGSPAVEAAGELTLPSADGPLVHLTVAATTMLGLDEEPGTLHGPRGPIPVPADLARDLAHRRGARWRRLLYDPATGVATDLSPSLPATTPARGVRPGARRPPDPVPDQLRNSVGAGPRPPVRPRMPGGGRSDPGRQPVRGGQA